MTDITPAAGPTPMPTGLPTGPIPTVAYDAIIEEGWGDSVAQSLNNLGQGETFLTWPDDTGSEPDHAAPTSSSFSVWFTPSQQLFVPQWAGISFFQVSLESIYDTTGGPSTYEVGITIGGVSTDRHILLTAPVAANLWFNLSWSCLVDVSALDGSQTVQIVARRVAGSSHWVFGAPSSALWIKPTYQGPVQWYGE